MYRSTSLSSNVVRPTMMEQTANQDSRSEHTVDKSSTAGEKKPVQSNAGHINLTKFPIDPCVVEIVPSKVVLHYKFMPLELRDGVLKIAVNSLNNITLFDDLRIFLGYDIMPFLAREEDILAMINLHYGIGSETIEGIIEHVFDEQKQVVATETATTEIAERNIEDASLIRFVNKILFDAYETRATDIHIEPYEDSLRIRFRVDGNLIKLNVADELVRLKASIIARIKIMGGLDIAEHRLPQDGRIKVKVNGRHLDLRISTLPTPHGESVNVRLLRSQIELDLQDLGFDRAAAVTMDEMLTKPHGIILVTGPTGSGKTSTLYTCLNKLNKEENKIITIEDPVEYNLTGITQMQTKPKIGFTFATGLRSILRHDPDIVMVGEIRDAETAEIAFRSSLTGHLVFSTLHTNSASQAITRVRDLGLASFLIADSLECVIAQRLVRVLCPHCRVSIPFSKEQYPHVRVPYPGYTMPTLLYKPVGCSECNHTGYYGRTAIYELLVCDAVVKRLIREEAPADDINAAAIRNGMKTLFTNGLEKVSQGITTLEEVLNVTGA